jgi:hypothetical protein
MIFVFAEGAPCWAEEAVEDSAMMKMILNFEGWNPERKKLFRGLKSMGHQGKAASVVKIFSKLLFLLWDVIVGAIFLGSPYNLQQRILSTIDGL